MISNYKFIDYFKIKPKFVHNVQEDQQLNRLNVTLMRACSDCLLSIIM